MEQIEVNIKLASNNLIYNLPIRKSETILKLKEFCQIISNIPPDQQNLLYKGKTLLNGKLIEDYLTENNQEIILVKKDEQKKVNIHQFSDNKEINPKKIADAFEKFPDLLSFCEKIDLVKLGNYLKLMKIGNSPGISNAHIQKLNEYLKDPTGRNLLKNISKKRSLVLNYFSDPIVQKDLQKIPILNLWLQYPEIYLTPQNFQKIQNMFPINGNNIIESSNISLSAPPVPFESLNINQNSQMMNSLGEISNINSFNNNSIENKEIFGNNEIDIDYRKEYKDQLSLLKSMGFIDEDRNIQILMHVNGNSKIAIEALLRYN